MVPVIAAALNVNWLPGVTRKTISEVERDYQRYRSIIDDNAGRPADVLDNVVDDVDDLFEQDWILEEDSGSCFTTEDHSAIAKAWAKLSRTVLPSGLDVSNLGKV